VIVDNVADILETHQPTQFNPEHEGSMYLQNVGNTAHNNTVYQAMNSINKLSTVIHINKSIWFAIVIILSLYTTRRN
jgi:hypothetical protein